MEIVDKEKFDDAKRLPEAMRKTDLEAGISRPLTDSEFAQMMEAMQSPVKAQQRIAVQIKSFLDQRISREMAEKGILSDHTRRWVETYNDVLEKIQKALYGDRSVNLHLHKVSHSQIAEKIRKYAPVEDKEA